MEMALATDNTISFKEFLYLIAQISRQVLGSIVMIPAVFI
jgi:hypothetical protein